MQQQQAKLSVPSIKLAKTGENVSRIGYGCMGLSLFYNSSSFSENDGLEVLGKAVEQGVNFFDTAYGYGKNEELLGKAMKQYGREKFFICTKVPPALPQKDGSYLPVPQTKENIKKYCYESLKRLDVEQIDLYYQHRVDPTIPMETQAEAFKELIEEGKIKYYGLSEASENSIRRAHKIHPVTAVQSEYSLFTRNVESNGVLNTCKELGIAFVAFSPLGRGVLTSAPPKLGGFQPTDIRNHLPRFTEENHQKNIQLVEGLKDIAKSLNCTTGQLALGWLIAQYDNLIPIPGTRREKYLEENNGSSLITIPQDILKKIDEMFPPGTAFGDRYPEMMEKGSNLITVELK